MPKRIRHKYAPNLGLLFAPLRNAEGGGGGGGAGAPAGDPVAGAAAAKPSDPAASAKQEGETPPAGVAGEADFEAKFKAQQTVNRDLETKLNQFRDGFKSLAGLDDKTKAPGADELIGTLTSRFDELSHELAVERTARAHGITDEEDLALLAQVKDAQQIAAFAARLAPKGDGVDSTKQTTGKPGSPKPDPSQGKGGGGGNKGGGVNAGRDLWDDRHPVKK